MPFRPLLLLAVGLTLPALEAGAQTIQRCEGADRRVSYSNGDCPAGTRPVRAVAPATQPSAEARQEARERAQRERQVAQDLAAQRQPPRTPGGQAYVTAEEARRAADCAYLRAELDSGRRTLSLLTTRPYYSTEDVEQLEARIAALASDYRRHCSR